ncbi:S8 family serine peptidase [Sphingobium sp. AS12]|uniref:S8 family serine peptidase n=1 Tax=Sphingobium sp. AS12 TaxID=2849495 RepID=UPI001C313C84|nr:S8 family serine peptidase [Sphingobium sp. AS12]MBV2149815.1 S8 family serine peptidase [Sphingobium sp. AS12]
MSDPVPEPADALEAGVIAAPGPIAFGEGLEGVIRESEALSEKVGELANDVRVTLAVTTLANAPIQNQRGALTMENYADYRPVPHLMDEAVARAEELGLTVVKRGRFGITVSGPAELVSELTGEPLIIQARQRRATSGSGRAFARNYAAPYPGDLFLSPARSLAVPAQFCDAVDHLVFTPPPLYFAPPSPVPPPYSFHGVDDAAIRRLLNVPAAQTGAGVTIAMVDTGFFDHPFFAASGYDYVAAPTSSEPSPHIDDNGHGTAMASNIFAVAPQAKLLGFKQSSPPQDALEDAADAGADIISCSWGYDYEQVFPILQATLLDIIQEGKIVLFAAGNGHYAWPGSQPEVLSIGGVFWNEQQELEASNYASGFMSSLFPGRRVPDVCGLVGQLPRAIYIMMPTQPQSTMDVDHGGTPHPQHDESASDDGWVGASGTSAATPQVAGIVALMLERARELGKPLSAGCVRSILESTAVAVTKGRNQMGMPAVGQPSTAVGWGLVDATAAIAQV